MSESYIAHAITAFSELGIGSSLGYLVNIVHIRTDLEAQLVVAQESQRVTRKNNHTIANQCDDTKNLWIRIKTYIRETIYQILIWALLAVLHLLPYVCIVLGIVALFGISFYPAIEISYFVISFASFMAVLWIPIFAWISKMTINRYAIGNIKIV